MGAIIEVLTQSLILSIMVLGVYISYKILDFPDLSADGSFTLGAAITAVALTNGISPAVGTMAALIAGLLAGLITGILHVKVKISNLLSGILVMGILYSINLRIMGRANIPLFTEASIFSNYNPLMVVFVIVAIFKILMDLFLKTGLGYSLKGVGDNPQMIKSLGIDIGKIKIFGLMLSNGLVAFSGSVMAQFQGFTDISMGIGTLILGIASIIIGTSVIKKGKYFKETTMVIVGTIIYQITIYFAMNTGLMAIDLKMITSVVIIIFMAVSNMKKGEIKNGGRIKNVKNTKPVQKLL
ncbi:MAG: ABC transporter permease [Tepidanaerobacteraceae bacterium]|nr:ABC transporter permease [Thermoanaerobacterales bacterium]